MFLKSFLFFIIIFFYNFAASENAEKFGSQDEGLLIRKISTGLLRGRKLITPSKVEGFVYLSIPTAEPPVGKLRFKAPIPRKRWEGIYNATNYSISCFWNSLRTTYDPEDFVMQEDCISANVFTNRKCLMEGGCAVVVYIHGGSFHFGTPLQYQPEALVDNFVNVTRNVVFVSIAFRQAFLGVSNFNYKLNLSTDLNAGFHDLIHGIKWVKNEINNFGGDPLRLTVMGDSGGASITRVLAMSPLSKHLMNQIIVCSVASDFEFLPDKNQNASRLTAKIVGCANFETTDPKWDDLKAVEEVIECLRAKSPKELSDSHLTVEAMKEQFKFIAMDSGENAIAPRRYEEMIKETLPIPVLTGTVAKEFLHSRTTIITLPDGTLAINDTDLHRWSYIALEDFRYLKPKANTVEITMKEYHSIPKSAYVFDDPDIYVPTYDFAVHQTLQGSNVFLYEYIYEEVGDAFDSGPKKIPKWRSPKHAQELAYLLGQHVGNFTEKDIQIRFLYSQIFVDFINHGTPNTKTRKWQKFDISKSNYFAIDFPDPKLESPGNKNGYHSETVKFWNIVLPSLEGPKTKIYSEKQLPYDPYVDATSIKKISKNGTKVLEINPITMMLTFQENQQMFHLSWAIMTWGILVIISLLICTQIAMCWKLTVKRNKYEYI